MSSGRGTRSTTHMMAWHTPGCRSPAPATGPRGSTSDCGSRIEIAGSLAGRASDGCSYLPTFRRLRVRLTALAFHYVGDHLLQMLFVIDVHVPATLGPPVLPHQGRSVQLRLLFQLAGAPGLELFARNLDGAAGGGDDDVDVIAWAVHGMQSPAAYRAVISNRL